MIPSIWEQREQDRIAAALDGVLAVCTIEIEMRARMDEQSKAASRAWARPDVQRERDRLSKQERRRRAAA